MDVNTLTNIFQNANGLQTASGQGGVGIAHLSLDGHCLEVNEQLCHITGYSRNELLSMTLRQVSSPDDVSRHLDTLGKLVCGEIETYSAEERCVHKKGRLVPVAVSAAVVRERNTREPCYVIALIDEVAKYRCAEEVLAKAQEKYAEAFRKAPIAIAISSTRDDRYLAVNEAFERHTGYHREEIVGRTAVEVGMWVDPTQRPALIERLETGSSGDSEEYTFRMKDGVVRTCLGSAELVEIHDEPCLIAAAVDITGRKRMTETLHEMGARLIEGQEAERKLIARELEEVVGQAVSLLTVQLGRVARTTRSERRHELEKLYLRAQDIASALSVISQELHPSLLEYVGLPRAIEDLCRQMGKAYGLKVAFKHKGVPASLSPGLALSLYRIAQETLQNVALHSGTQRAWLELEGQPNLIRLTVSDKGTGFDVASAKNGLGLLTIRERCRLLNGELAIESQAGGTRIEVRLPLR